MQAWLLTWEGTSARITAETKLIAIVSSRRSMSSIRDFVDILYSHTCDTAYLAARNANRRRERRTNLTLSGGIGERFFFGENPKIFARRVTELTIRRDDSAQVEIVSWMDPPYLKVERVGELPVVADPARRCRLVRPIHASLGTCLWSAGIERGQQLDNWYMSIPCEQP